MSSFQPANRAQKFKTIKRLQAQIHSLNRAIAALPPLCDCETKYTPEARMALANQLAALWEQDFQQELATGVRASMDFMDPSKNDEP